MGRRKRRGKIRSPSWGEGLVAREGEGGREEERFSSLALGVDRLAKQVHQMLFSPAVLEPPPLGVLDQNVLVAAENGVSAALLIGDPLFL